MSLLGLGRQPGQPRYDGQIAGSLQITEAVYATAIPILFGTKRLHGKLLDYFNFQAQKQSAPTGKGIFGSKGDYYEYFATVVTALAQGPCLGLINVWTYNGQLENLSSTYAYTVPGGGGSVAPVAANAAPIQLDLGVTKAVAYSVATNDYGGAPKTLIGTQNVPMVKVPSSPGAGQYSFNAGTGTYTFGAAEAGSNVSLVYSSMFSLYYYIQNQFDLVPASGPYEITPDNHDYYYEPISVTFLDTNTPGVNVSPASPTATGEYNIVIGYYTFYSGDAGRPVDIEYSYTSSDPDISSSSVLNLTFFNGAQSQAPWSYTESANPSHAFGYTGICYVASENLDLGQTAQMPPYNYEIVGQAIQPGTQDCNPCDVFNLLLADPMCGISFPASSFDIARFGFGGTSGYTTATGLPTTTSGSGSGMTVSIVASGGVIVGYVVDYYGSGYNVGDFVYPTQGGSSGDAYFEVGTWCVARAHWNANGYFISDCLEASGGIADKLGKYCEAGNTAAFFSAGLLKLVPYSEVSAVGNGSTYAPPTNPAATLTWDNILLPSGQKPGASLSDDFITNDRKASVDLYNYVQANYSQRINSYNNNLINQQSDGNIALVGERRESAQDWTFICLDAAAQWALSCRLNRGIYVDKTFKFSLTYTFDYLEPMDTLVLPTGIPVRITKIEEDENQVLAIEAENFLYGASSASIYPTQNPSRYQPTQSAADPGSTYPAFVQNTSQQTGGVLYRLTVAAAGTSANWGGCQIWISIDGVNYSLAGTINEICSVGILTAALPQVADPDTTLATLTNGGTSGYSNASNLPTTTSGSGTGLELDITVNASGVVTGGMVAAIGQGYALADKVYPTQAGSSGDAYFTISQVGDVLSVTMSPSGAELVGTTQAVADQFGTLCAIISPDGTTCEFISYENADMTAAGRYNLSYLRRGVDSTTPAAFPAGSTFVYIGNETLFQWQYKANNVGQPIYVKLPAFNLTGQAVQPLSQCKAYELFINAQGSAGTGQKYSPSAYADSGAVATVNPTAAYDGNVLSEATGTIATTGSASASDICTWSGFPSFVTNGSQRLYVSYALSLSITPPGGGTANITSSIGSIAGIASGSAAATFSIPIPSGTNIDTITVTATVSGGGGPGSAVSGMFGIYEIWVE